MLSSWARSLVLLALVLCPLQASAPIRGDRWLADAKYLSSDELKGRGNGSPELDKAADYVAGQFKAVGLEPLGGSYFQPFEATVGADMGPNNSLVLGGAPPHYKLRQDFLPLSMSDSGEYSGGLAFVGYGITAPEYHYDDYSGIDVKGKAVIVLRHEPQENDENSIFNGKRFTRHAALYSKAINARNHGAKAMLLVNDPLNHSDDRLIGFGEGGDQDMGLILFHVKREVAEQLLKQAGQSLATLQGAIDRDLSNHSFQLPSTVQVKLHADVDIRRATLKNVVGYLQGSDPKLRQEVIVIGGHYDHLGLGGKESMAPKLIGQIHHGADDNASGAAGVMELARTMTADGPKPRRSVLFITFAGEELGLFGSANYVEHPLLPLSQTIAMMNLDMIGRARQNKLFVGGVGTSPGFRRLVEEENKNPSFQIDFSDSGYDASDHMSFARKGVPVIFFFSGLHADYHKPSDTWDKLEPEETARVLELVTRIVQRIDAADERPPYVRVRDDKRYGGGDSGGYGTYFGSIPDFGESTKGVKFADVSDGSPAAKAGLRGGDVLIEFDGKPIQNLYDFTDALSARSPGDEVTVVVMRGEEKISVKVKLASRQ